MSWPRESLFIALLLIAAPWVSADTIEVNTTTDDNTANSLCSLREAVEYFNQGSPKDGYQGCKTAASDSSNIITLPENEDSYLIGPTGAIVIRTPLTINGAGSRGDALTTIQVQGAHRAFIVNQNPQFEKPKCARTTPSLTCAPTFSDGSTFDLYPASDTGAAAGDYLTPVHSPIVFGSVHWSGTMNAAHSILVRIYDNPKDDDPLQVGSATTDPLTMADLPWQLKLNRSLADGVHHLTYTTQEVLASNSTAIDGLTESDPSAPLLVAIYTNPQRASVTFNQVIIKGCASASGCADYADDNTAIVNDPSLTPPNYDDYALSYRQGLTGTNPNPSPDTMGNGGVIFSNEEVLVVDSLVQDGIAGLGGAIYTSDDGGAQIRDSDVRANKANQGAAVYSLHNSLAVERSLVRENVVTGSAGVDAVIEVGDSTPLSGVTTTYVVNSTISGNDGLALSLGQDMTVNNSTIVLNSDGGIYFRDATTATVYNTILAGNHVDSTNLALPVSPYLDCTGPSVGSATVQKSLLLSSDGCPTSGNNVISNAPNTNEQLMATLDVNGRCTSPYGLLCPLADHGEPTLVHMPRVLPGYASLSQSPIINQGSPKVGGYDPDACSTEDQRSKARNGYSCDIGSVELQQVASGATASSGGTITYGGTYTQYLGDDLADEELLPLALCPGTPPADPAKVVAGSYRNDVPGCPWLETDATRGKVTFNAADGTYSYKPFSDFHGFDVFDIHVMTTLTNLNSLDEDKSHVVRAQVIVEPSTSMVSSKLGGAFDAWGMLLLGALGLGWRGRRQA